jgi:multiple sugar transport system permease protein
VKNAGHQMRSRKSRWQASVPHLFLFPQLILVGLFSLYPFVYNIILSVQEFGLAGGRFVGLENYRRLLSDPVFWIAMKNTTYYTLLTVPPTSALALLAAIGLNQRLHGMAFFRTVYLFPNLVSWVVIGLIWQWMYSVNYGVLNQALRALGLQELRWLQDPTLTIPSIAIASVWHDLGYYMVIFLAGLQSISPTIYEAARIDGANAWAQFRLITIPLLRPILFLVLVLSMINSFKVFDQIYVMTGGGPGRASLMIVNYIISVAMEEMRMGYASAISVVLFAVTLTVLQKRVFRGNDLGG